MRLDSFFFGALCVTSGGRLPAALFMVFQLDSKGAKVCKSCEAVLKAVAAIESATPAHGARKASNAEKTQHPNTKRPDIRCEVFDPKDGLKIRYTECNLTMAYGRWSHHVDEKHNANKSQDQVDEGNVEAENRPAPKKRAEPKKATKKVAMKEPKKKAKPGGK